MTTDEQAIHDILKQLEVAWNAKDSENFAAPFAEDANFIATLGDSTMGVVPSRPRIGTFLTPSTKAATPVS